MSNIDKIQEKLENVNSFSQMVDIMHDVVRELRSLEEAQPGDVVTCGAAIVPPEIERRRDELVHDIVDDATMDAKLEPQPELTPAQMDSAELKTIAYFDKPEEGKTYPHCDWLVLHKPGECQYCDMSPDLQQFRIENNVNFTGESDPSKISCPAERNRPVDVINQWPGNQSTLKTPHEFLGLGEPVVMSASYDLPADKYTTDRNDPRLVEGQREQGTNDTYLVMSPEERGKGFVRPVRGTYVHIGKQISGEPVMLANSEREDFVEEGWVAFIPNPDKESSVSGTYVTQFELDTRKGDMYGGCGVATTMSQPLSETYAARPTFYGATFCVGCNKHLPVGEFRWDDGTVVGS